MNAVTQWMVVAGAVALAIAYALRVLLPVGARRALARFLRARGATAVAESVEGGAGGCDACAGNPRASARRQE